MTESNATPVAGLILDMQSTEPVPADVLEAHAHQVGVARQRGHRYMICSQVPGLARPLAASASTEVEALDAFVAVAGRARSEFGVEAIGWRFLCDPGLRERLQRSIAEPLSH